MTIERLVRQSATCVWVILTVLFVGCGREDAGELSNPAPAAQVRPFINVVSEALIGEVDIWNERPGIVIFDYDRDGALDFFVTNEGGYANWLYRNEGGGSFVDVAAQAGVAATESFSSGAVACDFNNDGYQDLYVGAVGHPNDSLDFRSPSDAVGSQEQIEALSLAPDDFRRAHWEHLEKLPHVQGNRDLLFLNNGDGTFRDITDSAFGEAVNLRSALSIACADVDNDGWLDIYVGNLAALEFRTFDTPSHPGHYNVLYRNNGDLTFTDVTEEAGVQGPQILMRDSDGQPILFEDPETQQEYEGYDPSVEDFLGNRVGEPTGQTHAVLFFDYDTDGDPDLWVANDGDRLHVYRNDSTPGNIRFTPVARAMGIDLVGNWMGFAVGDYDGDADLDVFVTNMGYHMFLRPTAPAPGAGCDYHARFNWGTCHHFLLRNDGTREVAGLGTVGMFPDVSSATEVIPSPLMPPESLDPANIDPAWPVPTGLAAYDFGFGATFFDVENDGDQDLYWLGSTVARGEAPGGQLFPGAGRMLRGNGEGGFEDITVLSHLLDIQGVDYSITDSSDPEFVPEILRISNLFHENGKAVAAGDLDGDGYADLIATNSSGDLYTTRGLAWAPGPLFVWMNPGGENHWITLRLKGRMAIDGTGSNADGIGARVYVTTTTDSQQEPLVQVQEARAGSSYLSMDSADLEFGLGRANRIDEIEIFWPSGQRQTLRDLDVDQVLAIEEPSG